MMKSNKICVLLIAIILMFVTELSFFVNTTIATELDIQENQYMELKIVSIEDTEENGTQIILEWWSHNLSFKGVDVRFSYDNTKLQPSNIATNEATNGTDCFEFLNGFGGYLNIFQVNEAEENVLRYVISMNPPYTQTNEYFATSSEIGDYVDTETAGDVLIGRMSFNLLEGNSSTANIDETAFALKPSETSPTTGIKISKTSTEEYTNQFAFRFTKTSTQGIIEGSIETTPTASTTAINKANITIYNNEEVENLVDWDARQTELLAGYMLDDINEQLKNLTPVYETITNDDGTYQIKLSPGTYTMLIDKTGYLDLVYTNIEITDNTISLEKKVLYAGDTDKNAIINNNDIVKMYQCARTSAGDENFAPACDFDNNDKIDNNDTVITYQNNKKIREVINMKEENI